MFHQQSILLAATPTVRQVVSRYPSWQPHPADWLDSTEAQARRFVVPVPLVGAFSAGKSTLINGLIGFQLLSSSIEPETAVPAEVWHSDTEQLTGCLPNGQRLPLTREALRNNQVQPLLNGGWVEAALPIPLLQGLHHIKLVDMPGWDSGIQAHSAAIDSYASRSLAYGVVVSADEGTVHESIRTALRELAVRHMPVFVVVTKADKKPPEELPAICNQVAQEVEKAIGQPPLMVCVASGRKNEVGQFIAALQMVEQRAEALFATHVAQPFAQQLTSLCAHLGTLLNSDDLDSEKIAAQCSQLEADMKAFGGHLQTETAALDARVQPIMGRMQQRMESRLVAQLDALTSSALSGHDLSGPIGTTLRLAVQEGMRDDFNPEVEHYLGRVADGLPATFQATASTGFDFNTRLGTESASSGSVLPAVVATVLPILSNLHPVAKIAALVVPGLIAIFQGKADKEAEENRRREQALQHIRGSVIPAALAQACDALAPVLHANVAKAKQIIADNVQAQQRSHEAALAELQTQLARGQAAFAQQCEQYRADQTTLSTTLAQLN